MKADDFAMGENSWDFFWQAKRLNLVSGGG